MTQWGADIGVCGWCEGSVHGDLQIGQLGNASAQRVCASHGVDAQGRVQGRSACGRVRVDGSLRCVGEVKGLSRVTKRGVECEGAMKGVSSHQGRHNGLKVEGCDQEHNRNLAGPLTCGSMRKTKH